MEIRLIKTDKAYRAALHRIEELFDAEPGTSEGDELELLVTLVDKYETENFPIPEPHPVEAIKFMMEQQGIDDKTLGKIINSRSRVSEILKLKRRLTLPMIQKLHKHLSIPAEILIKNYELAV